MDTEQNEERDLLGQTRSLRRLARGILYDPAQADDIVYTPYDWCSV